MRDEEVEKIWGEEGGRRRTVVGEGGMVGGMVGGARLMGFGSVMGGSVGGRIASERVVVVEGQWDGSEA